MKNKQNKSNILSPLKECIKDIQEHNDDERYFKEKLSPENLRNKMTEHESCRIYGKILASKFWGNKDLVY